MSRYVEGGSLISTNSVWVISRVGDDPPHLVVVLGLDCFLHVVVQGGLCCRGRLHGGDEADVAHLEVVVRDAAGISVSLFVLFFFPSSRLPCQALLLWQQLRDVQLGIGPQKQASETKFYIRFEQTHHTTSAASVL